MIVFGDEMEGVGWHMAEMCERERVKLLSKALQECKEKGVSDESLRTLAFETGATWEAPEHKEKQHAVGR